MILTEHAIFKGLQGDLHQLEPLSGQKLGQIGQPITGCCELAVTHLGGELPAEGSTCAHSALKSGNGRMGRRWEAMGFCQSAAQGLGIEQKLRTGVVAHSKGSTGQWGAPAATGEPKACHPGLARSVRRRWAEPMGREAGTTRPCSQRRSGADRSPVRAPESPSRRRAGHAQAVASPVRGAGAQQQARALRAARCVSTTADLPNLDMLLAFVREVARAIGAGSRIGQNFLQTAEQVVTLNHWQQQGIARLLITKLFGTVRGKRIGVLGFAFKADTNVTRESPAIRICKDLLEEGAILQTLDPKVSERQMALDLGQPAGAGEGSWHQVPGLLQAAAGTDALVLLTEWQQFTQIDCPAVAAVMRQPAWLFESRARAEAAAARAAGLQVWTVGEG